MRGLPVPARVSLTDVLQIPHYGLFATSVNAVAFNTADSIVHPVPRRILAKDSYFRILVDRTWSTPDNRWRTRLTIDADCQARSDRT